MPATYSGRYQGEPKVRCFWASRVGPSPSSAQSGWVSLACWTSTVCGRCIWPRPWRPWFGSPIGNAFPVVATQRSNVRQRCISHLGCDHCPYILSGGRNCWVERRSRLEQPPLLIEAYLASPDTQGALHSAWLRWRLKPSGEPFVARRNLLKDFSRDLQRFSQKNSMSREDSRSFWRL